MARPRKSHDTRKRLLEEGANVLLRRGYHGSGLQTVLDRVGVPKGSFYNYFPSKEEFGAEVVRHYGAEFDAQLESMIAEAKRGAAKALRKFFRSLITEFEGMGHHGGCLVGNLGGELEDSEACRVAMLEVIHGWRDRLKRALEIGQEQKEFRTDRSATDLADTLLNSWEGAVLRMKIERSSKPLTQWLEVMLTEWLAPSK
jgi:TetR/AcrR family transcriptional regulator, transcriptional repressor for nem operon